MPKVPLFNLFDRKVQKVGEPKFMNTPKPTFGGNKSLELQRCQILSPCKTAAGVVENSKSSSKHSSIEKSSENGKSARFTVKLDFMGEVCLIKDLKTRLTSDET